MMAIKHMGAAALLALASTGAMAHALVTKSSPGQGAVLDAAPQEVTITFNEKVEKLFSTATLTNAAGATLSTAKAKVDAANPALLRLAVPALGPGQYVVKWTAVGSDGHRRSGDIGFSIKASAPAK